MSWFPFHCLTKGHPPTSSPHGPAGCLWLTFEVASACREERRKRASMSIPSPQCPPAEQQQLPPCPGMGGHVHPQRTASPLTHQDLTRPKVPTLVIIGQSWPNTVGSCLVEAWLQTLGTCRYLAWVGRLFSCTMQEGAWAQDCLCTQHPHLDKCFGYSYFPVRIWDVF